MKTLRFAAFAALALLLCACPHPNGHHIYGGGAYTVAFDSSGGTPVSSRSAAGGALIDEPLPPPDRPGYIFDGWFSEDGMRYTWPYTVTGDVTMYARWHAILPAVDTPPGPITHLTADTGSNTVTFTWQDPTDGDFAYVEIWCGSSGSDKPGDSAVWVQVPKGAQTYTVTDSTAAGALYFHFRAVDAAGNRSPVVNYEVPLPLQPPPPAEVTKLTGVITGADEITLTWTDPAASAFAYVEITCPSFTGTTHTVYKGTQSDIWNGLSSGTTYTFTVKAFYTGGLSTAGLSVTRTLAEDTTPPGPVTNLISVNGGFGSVTLNWLDPADADLQYVEITCAQISGPARTVNKGTQTYTWHGLAGGETYTFTLKTVDSSGNRSLVSVSVSGTPLDTTPPAAVTNLTALAGSGCVILTWTDPADTDLSRIQIECNGIAGPAKEVYPGTGKYTWYEGGFYPDVLTNDTPYTFTFKAVDYNGNRSAAVTVGSTPHEGTLAQRIAAAASGDTVTLYTHEAVPAAIGIGKTIILEGYDSEKTLRIDGYSGAMFSVAAGGSLTLDDKVTLKGKSGNNAAVVTVAGGSLVMEDGSKITGNSTTNSAGGGVQVNSGMFIMKGGTISENRGANASPWIGSGVQVNGGTFKMEGGIISRNSTPGSGGGVGVYSGTFIKSDTTDNDSGTIYGNDGGVDRNIMNSDGGGADYGHAVYVKSGGKIRDKTAGPTDILDSSKAGAAGGWE